MEEATFLDTFLGTPSATPSCQPIIFELVLGLAGLREPILMENYFRRGLARSSRAESHPIFSVLCVKLPDGRLLVLIEIQFFHGHLMIKASAGNSGRRLEECQTRTGFLKSMSRISALPALAAVLVLAVGLSCSEVEGRTSHGWFTI